MNWFEFGVVLTSSPKEWSDIVPAQFIYSNCFERVIRRIIDRQLAILELEDRSPRVCIIIDNIDLFRLDTHVIGFVRLNDLGSVLKDLNIRMYTGKIKDGKKFPIAWSWARSALQKTQLKQYIDSENNKTVYIQ
jgi:hypothetical protein